MADFDASLMEQVLNVAKGEREPHVEHHRQADDVRGCFEIAEGRRFCLLHMLRSCPRLLKPVCSDTASVTAMRTILGEFVK